MISNHIKAFLRIVHHLLYISSFPAETTIKNPPYSTRSNAISPSIPNTRLVIPLIRSNSASFLSPSLIQPTVMSFNACIASPPPLCRPKLKSAAATVSILVNPRTMRLHHKTSCFIMIKKIEHLNIHRINKKAKQKLPH